MAEDIPVSTKTRILKKKRVMKDGTVKEYISKEIYSVKGVINTDGTVSKFSLDQKNEMKRLRSIGVTIKRIAQDFNTSSPTVRKIINE